MFGWPLMEKNTYVASSYIAAPLDAVYAYLCDLNNLDEWTLFSKMKEKVDDSTWIGTASAYQRPLYYHLRKGSGRPFPSMEWHCGFEYGKYFQVYPTYLFTPDYIEPGSTEPGVYFHWLSFADPARRTPMYSAAVEAIHASERRALKNVLERNAGLSEAATGRYSIKTATIYVDAPIEVGAEYLADPRNMLSWAHFVRSRGERGAETGELVDEYARRIDVALRTYQGPHEYVIEHDTSYLDYGVVVRAPMLLYPCDYVFAEKAARGFILQRVSFWRTDAPPRLGKLQLEDYHAENINIKRLLEASVGRPETFAKGPSYTSG